MKSYNKNNNTNKSRIERQRQTKQVYMEFKKRHGTKKLKSHFLEELPMSNKEIFYFPKYSR